MKCIDEETFTVEPEIFDKIKLGDELEVKYKGGLNTIEDMTVKETKPREKIY